MRGLRARAAPGAAAGPKRAGDRPVAALGAPWTNVGAPVALVGGAARASADQVSLGRCRRGLRSPVAIASFAERGTLRRGARRPLMVGVSSNTNALRGASMMPGRRRASSGSSSRSRTSKPTSSANQGVPLADQRQLLLPVSDNYFCRSARRADGA